MHNLILPLFLFVGKKPREDCRFFAINTGKKYLAYLLSHAYWREMVVSRFFTLSQNRTKKRNPVKHDVNW